MRVAFLGIISFSLFGSAASQVSTAGGTVFEQPYWTETPVIEVLGRAQVELPPNRASFSVSFVETDRDAKRAMQNTVERAKLAYEAIKIIAGQDAIVTTSVDVSPYYEQYRDRDGDRVENRRPDKVKGYEGRASISVTVRDVTKAGEARAAALALGPEDAGRMRLFLERTAETNRKAYAAAVADAAARAEASAAASNSRLGRLLVVQEGQGPCLGRWTSQPGIIRQQDLKSADRRRMQSPSNLSQETIIVTGTRAGADLTITQSDIDALNLPSDQPPQMVSAQVCALYAIEE